MIARIAEKERDGARPNDDRNDEQLDPGRALEIRQQNGVETVRRRAREDRHALFARGRQETREVERHADADDAVARRTGPPRVAPLGDVGVDDEERRKIEILAREIEHQIEERVAVLGRLELLLGSLEMQRPSAASRRSRGGDDVTLQELRPRALVVGVRLRDDGGFRRRVALDGRRRRALGR